MSRGLSLNRHTSKLDPVCLHLYVFWMPSTTVYLFRLQFFWGNERLYAGYCPFTPEHGSGECKQKEPPDWRMESESVVSRLQQRRDALPVGSYLARGFVGSKRQVHVCVCAWMDVFACWLCFTPITSLRAFCSPSSFSRVPHLVIHPA